MCWLPPRIFVIGFQNGLSVGNQQWSWINVNVTGSTVSCVNQIWNWHSSFLSLSVANCPIGIQFCGASDGSIAILDSVATNVPLVFQADKIPPSTIFCT